MGRWSAWHEECFWKRQATITKETRDMTDHDESLIDKVKNALGMGDDSHDERHADDRPADDRNVESGVPADQQTGDRNDTWGVDGATQATGREGIAGGTGATAALGGAGASGPVGADPEPSLGEGADDAERVDAGAVRTEYEMGHEFDPDHETRAESGVTRGEGANTRGEAASGESPFAGEGEDVGERRG
jgi:hypothetical protein